jgi:hypothetical protein
MTETQITSAQYCVDPLSDTNSSIRATIDGQELFVPLDPANRHYAAILKAVEEGTLVIQEATA